MSTKKKSTKSVKAAADAVVKNYRAALRAIEKDFIARIKKSKKTDLWRTSEDGPFAYGATYSCNVDNACAFFGVEVNDVENRIELLGGNDMDFDDAGKPIGDTILEEIHQNELPDVLEALDKFLKERGVK